MISYLGPFFEGNIKEVMNYLWLLLMLNLHGKNTLKKKVFKSVAWK
jgi:hypothetical protein